MLDKEVEKLIENFVSERISDVCVKVQKQEEYKVLMDKYLLVIDKIKLDNDRIENMEDIRCQMEQKKYENIYKNGFKDAILLLLISNSI